MSEIGDMWIGLRDRNKVIKAQRVTDAITTLKKLGIAFERKNNDNHLVIEGVDCFIDFWPSTGNWAVRLGKKGNGLNNLLTLMGKYPSQNVNF
jgi:hypothetical protein